MTIDDKIRDEKLHMTLKKKQEEYQHYHQVKLIKEILNKANNITSQVYIFFFRKCF